MLGPRGEDLTERPCTTSEGSRLLNSPGTGALGPGNGVDDLTYVGELLLDGVCSYLPDPREVENVALDLSKNEEPVILESNPNKPLVMLAFKLEDGRYGQLTYVRVYQGKVAKDDFIVNSRNGKRVKVVDGHRCLTPEPGTAIGRPEARSGGHARAQPP